MPNLLTCGPCGGPCGGTYTDSHDCPMDRPGAVRGCEGCRRGECGHFSTSNAATDAELKKTLDRIDGVVPKEQDCKKCGGYGRIYHRDQTVEQCEECPKEQDAVERVKEDIRHVLSSSEYQGSDFGSQNFVDALKRVCAAAMKKEG